MRTLMKTAALAAVLAIGAGAAQAETAYGLREGQIVIFDTATPGTINFAGALTGVQGGEWLIGIDFRPANRQLYGLGSFGNLYTISQSGGGFVATQGPSLVNGMGMDVNPNGTNFGFDFNPTADRLRVHAGTEQNLRINVDTGLTIVDGTLTNLGGGDPELIGAAYTNNVPGGPGGTMLYAIDEATDSLVLFTNANNGTFNAVGALGVSIDASDSVGFDISGATGTAFLSVRNNFYSVNLGTGAATSLGSITGGEFMDFSIAPVPEPATWAMMIGGFGLIGTALRRRRLVAVA